MSDWRTLKISDVAEVIGGGTPSSKREDYYGGHIPWLTPKDLSGYSDKYISGGERSITEDGLKNSSAKILPKNSVLITSRAPIGYVAIASKPLATNQGFKSLILKSDYDPNFFYYLIKSNIAKLEAVSSGSTFKEISGSVLKAVEFDIPDSETQKAISNLLNPLDDKIALNRKLNATLEAMAQALFQSWFVDFDPVKAKLAAVRCGRDPEQAAMAAIACKLVVPPGKPKAETLDAQLPSAEAIDAAIAALDELSEAQRQSLKEKAAHFPADFQESELGLIPQGWEVKSVFDLSKPRRGKTITKAKTTKGDIPVVAGGITPAYYHNAFNTPAPAVTISASGANAGFVNLYMDNIWASDCSFINAGTTDLVFFSYTMLKVRQNEIFDMQQGAAQPHVYPKDFKRMKLSFSPKLAQLLELEFKDFYLLNKNLAHESRTLAELRDALLPKLLSGEISVSPN